MKFALVCGLVLCSTMAMGADENNSQQDESRENSTQESKDDSSAGNRQGKVVDFGLQALGSTVAPFGSIGFMGGAYLNSDMVVEAEYTKASNTSLVSGTTVDIITYGVRMKNYWGNSFYTNLGLGMRKISINGSVDFEVNGTVVLADEKISVDVSSTVLDFAIGNKWQFENFNIGCDWVGFLVPISNSNSDNLPTLEGSKERDDLEDSKKVLGELPSLQLLRLFIGASF